MKITDVRTVLANKFMYVTVHTDEGIVGTGESGAWGFLEASAEAVNVFRPYLIGEDPTRIEHHWQYMYRSFHFRGAAIMGAISAIDIALWDIYGKKLDLPTYRILGGGARERVRTYYHVQGGSTEEIIASCVAAKEKGYTAVGHLSPFLDEPRQRPYFMSYSAMVTDAEERVRAIREAVGTDVDLCLELHRRLTPAEAVAFSRAVEKYRPLFLEDPTRPDNFDSMSYVAKKSHVPIATGERLHTAQEFQMLLARGGVNYARVSVCLAGGITGALKIAALAEAHDVQIVPHNPLSPVSTAACLQVAIAAPNCAIMELPNHRQASASEVYTSNDIGDVQSLNQHEIAGPVPEAVDGFIEAPDRTGIGIELLPNVEDRFPFERRAVNTRLHRDGSVVDQ